MLHYLLCIDDSISSARPSSMSKMVEMTYLTTIIIDNRIHLSQVFCILDNHKSLVTAEFRDISGPPMNKGETLIIAHPELRNLVLVRLKLRTCCPRWLSVDVVSVYPTPSRP